MSRIGKKPIAIPDGVDVKIDGQSVQVKGPKGSLSYEVHPLVRVAQDDIDGQKSLVVNVTGGGNAFERSIWGTTRANVANLIQGVTEGYKKSLEVIGVGYKVNLKGNTLVLDVGFSHSVPMELPEGVTATVDKNQITIEGINKADVGNFAANVRKVKKPEPYKGKGIKYVDEVVRRKAGKAAKAAE